MKLFYDGKPILIDDFINIHPGGPEYLYEYENKDIKSIFHEFHSENAQLMLNSMLQIDDKLSHDKIDLNKPLLAQLLTLNKSEYLYLIHHPSHTTKPVILFGNPFLEIFGKTKWYAIPIIWMPCILYALVHSPYSIYFTSILFGIGLFLWSFIEYCLHRFVFHSDESLIDHPYAILTHYLLHGIHHLSPMDPYRLVMPPILALIYTGILLGLASLIIPEPLLYGLYAGTKMGYVCYDVFHYALHHYAGVGHVGKMKQLHLKHHYKSPDMGFGITSTLWDHVFGTVL
eukprot:NODE_951_length_2926_cov_1.033958.p2 type:complete len:286 gc:universal NODE_951_length_2926_cov_1.033958:1611-754(-)